MAETSRSKSDLLTNLPDNIIGSITPEDVRDIVMSMFGSYAEILVQEGVTSQAITATPVKMTGFATNGLAVGCSPDATNDDITIDVAGIYDVSLTCSFSGDANDNYYLSIRKNGADAGLAFLERTLGPGGDVGSASTQGRVNCAATDVISVYVWSDTGGTSFVPHQASLTVKRIG